MSEVTGTALPINEAVLFSNHKEKQTRGVEKRQRKYLEKLAFIRPFLNEDEEILLITTACSPTGVLEQLVTGWIVYYLKRSLLVFTDQRILHIPTTRTYAYRHSIAQVDYADCKGLRMSFSSLKIDYKSGKTEKFYYIGRPERKKIKALIADLPIGGEGDSSTERTFLCPRCTASLETGGESCRSCRLEFKNRKDARMISIFIPGGGYFYTRHYVLGAFDALVEVYLIWFVYVFTLGELSGEPDAMSVAILGAIALFIEKLITIYHSNHFLDEFLPVEKDVQMRTTRTV